MKKARAGSALVISTWVYYSHGCRISGAKSSNSREYFAQQSLSVMPYYVHIPKKKSHDHPLSLGMWHRPPRAPFNACAETNNSICITLFTLHEPRGTRENQEHRKRRIRKRVANQNVSPGDEEAASCVPRLVERCRVGNWPSIYRFPHGQPMASMNGLLLDYI
ncbi:hypothetical protein HDV57DRAFT_490823 [Trichoderma longibrachiatum]